MGIDDTLFDREKMRAEIRRRANAQQLSIRAWATYWGLPHNAIYNLMSRPVKEMIVYAPKPSLAKELIKMGFGQMVITPEQRRAYQAKKIAENNQRRERSQAHNSKYKKFFAQLAANYEPIPGRQYYGPAGRLFTAERKPLLMPKQGYRDLWIPSEVEAMEAFIEINFEAFQAQLPTYRRAKIQVDIWEGRYLKFRRERRGY